MIKKTERIYRDADRPTTAKKLSFFWSVNAHFAYEKEKKKTTKGNRVHAVLNVVQRTHSLIAHFRFTLNQKKL